MTRSRAGRLSLGRLAAVVLLVVLTAACRPGNSTYFPQTSSAAQSGSAPAGTKVYAGIATLEVKPGDQVTFKALETSTPGVRALGAPLRTTNGGIGLARAIDLTAADLAPYRDLEGLSFSADDGPIGILIEVTVPANQLDIVSPVLTFTVNGRGPEQERLLMAVRVCPAASTSDPCPAPDPPPIEGQ